MIKRVWVLRELTYLDDIEHTVGVFTIEKRAKRYEKYMRHANPTRNYVADEWYLDPQPPDGYESI